MESLYGNFDNYLTSRKCWLKMHNNLKKGDETEDKLKSQCLIGYRWAWPNGHHAGLLEGTGFMLQGYSHLAP